MEEKGLRRVVCQGNAGVDIQAACRRQTKRAPRGGSPPSAKFTADWVTNSSLARLAVYRRYYSSILTHPTDKPALSSKCCLVMSRSQSASTSKIGTSHARKLPLKGHSLPSPGPTSTSLFVTNLRLLDLDTLPDWPKITAQLLSSNEAQQNAKYRIRCVEWALYRLFELWDPAETREVRLPLSLSPPSGHTITL